MEHTRGFWVWMAALLAVSSLALAGCAGQETKFTPLNAPAVFACVDDAHLEKDVAAEAELEDFSCSFKKWEGSETLHFNVAIKNVSQQPRRYRVNIFLDNGKAVGGLIPRKTKGGLVEPGKSASFIYPVKEMPESPKAATIVISTLGS